MKSILIIRFSAIGDVAMSVPVLHSLAAQYPDYRITVLSKAHLQPLFSSLPANVSFLGVNLQADYAGFKGLNRLYSELKRLDFDYVVDLHNVLRTKYLSFRFRLDGVAVSVIDKGRRGKKELVRKKNKKLTQQTTSIERYKKAIEKTGCSIKLDFLSIFGEEKGDFTEIVELTGEKKGLWVGIAPFAQHRGKIYPLEKMKKVVSSLNKQPNITIFLFGGGEKEKQFMEEWESEFDHVYSVIGKLKMNLELILMSHLDMMVSMDSSNMHFASLVNTPVLTLWGATHPFAGFLGWRQSEELIVQNEELPCRPCSIYGQKECFRGDYACMNSIKEELVVSKILDFLNSKEAKNK